MSLPVASRACRQLEQNRLCDKVSCCCFAQRGKCLFKALTSCDDIIDHQDSLAFLHSISLNLEEILPILLIKRRLLGRTRQLAPLTDRSKARTECQSQAGTKEEASCVESDHYVWSDTIVEGLDLQFEGTNERSVYGVISEERQNVDEIYSRNREVWELTQCGP